MLRAFALVSLVTLLGALPASAISIAYRPPGGIGGIGGGGVIWWPPPVTDPPPSKPAYLGVSLAFVGATSAMPRTPTMNMRVGWRNVSNAATATIIRTSPDYTTIATLSNVVANTDSLVVDAHPAVDALNCYRVTVADAQGRQTLSDTACMITPDGAIRPLWRAQLEVDVANVSDAGTDSDVAIRLDSPTGLYGASFLPSGNNTWIDTPADDFEQASHRTYELQTNHLTGGLPLGAQADVSDVKMITLVVTDDDDAMCVQGLNLKLNGQSMFQKTFPSCVWVTPASPLTIDTPELRASPLWHADVPAQGLNSFTYEMIDSVATLAVSQELHARDISWRSTFFEGNPETWSGGDFVRNYEWAISYYGPVNLQASLAIENTCVNGSAHARLYVADVDADAASFYELLAPLTEAIVNALAPSFPTLFDKSMDLGLSCSPGANNFGLCFAQNGLGLCQATF